MGLEKPIGGQRLGAGGKRTEELPEYGRSTHNLAQHWRSSMAAGILYPCCRFFMDLGDSVDIDIFADMRTLPTKGPLFGSFKTQVDFFTVPLRLYQGILHNNPVDIGMKMNQVYLPKIYLDYEKNAPKVYGSDDDDWQVNNSALLKYLELSGIGRFDESDEQQTAIQRKINAVPLLGYYDIFKNYYANKQEENAYVITPEEETISEPAIETIGYEIYAYVEGEGRIGETRIYSGADAQFEMPDGWTDIENLDLYVTIKTNLNWDEKPYLAEDWLTKAFAAWEVNQDTFADIRTNVGTAYLYNIGLAQQSEDNKVNFRIKIKNTALVHIDANILIFTPVYANAYSSRITLTPFALSNIDNMRNALLKKNEPGEEFIMGVSGYLPVETDWDVDSGKDETGLPYSANFKMTESKINYSSFAQSGLLVKTYQNDLFNNWIQTDWIEGENGIAALSAVNVENGQFKIDALLLAKATYNMLNAVALSGGTYEDWQEAKTGVKAVRRAETPIFEGGLTGEIAFTEVISNAAAGTGEDFEPLGSLGGRGAIAATKNGRNLHIKANEPCYIMAIASITPRISQSQGNAWDLTEIDTMDDWHKAAYDQIGFQDLITEQMAWWDTMIYGNGGLARYSAGKVPAWSNYTTAVDKCYGDFAKTEGKGFMVLNRNYEQDPDTGRLKDCTTYIDPAKFNYAFAKTDLASNNFWADIYFDIRIRRVMSAHMIPHA